MYASIKTLLKYIHVITQTAELWWGCQASVAGAYQSGPLTKSIIYVLDLVLIYSTKKDTGSERVALNGMNAKLGVKVLTGYT